MKGVSRALAAAVLLGVLLSGCLSLQVTPPSADLCSGPVQLTAMMVHVEHEVDVASAGLVGPPPDHSRGYWLAWYRDGELVGEEDVTTPWNMNKTDYEAHFWASQPGAYYAVIWLCARKGAIPQYTSSVSVVRACGASNRADVSVVIYGGWDGIAVDAYVGGTEQETMYTAQDAFGEAAVLWTFYPPNDGWGVSVAPQTPPGKDAEEWQYELIRIETRGGGTVESPTSADAIIYPGSEKVFYFQLVNTTAE